MMKFLKRFYLGIILVFLYVPIGVLIVQSFNAGKSRAKWEGFSFRWYVELFQDTRIMNALYVTLSIAVLAMIFATILGTLAAIGIYSMKKRPQALMMTLTNLPNTKHTYEAALDLGATPTYALTHVILPECKQGIITGAMLAFTLSLDDFTISYFTTSPLVQNLSTLIYSAARKGIEPTLNALSALMFISLLVLLLIVNRRTAENN